ncbi:MAG TPA: DUF4279 domain-containing protein [Polyangiaceae bacterium]|nr:DUF4279 domain-containing protein [Polyangiaceae bacterium]
MNDTQPPQVVATVGGPVDEASVTLAVYGETLDPDYITTVLGCTPSSSHRKGDRKREGSVPYKLGAWFLQERANPPATVDDLLGRLFARVPERPDAWRSLAVEFDVQVRFSIFLAEWNRGFSVSKPHLQRLAAMGVSLEFDIYADQLG